MWGNGNERLKRLIHSSKKIEWKVNPCWRINVWCHHHLLFPYVKKKVFNRVYIREKKELQVHIGKYHNTFMSSNYLFRCLFGNPLQMPVVIRSLIKLIAWFRSHPYFLKISNRIHTTVASFRLWTLPGRVLKMCLLELSPWKIVRCCSFYLFWFFFWG